MKVIFVKKVPKVGTIGDIKDQPDGYVRNFLLPKGYAIIATPEAIKKLERARSEVRIEKEVQTDLFKKNIQAVNGVAVTISAVANEHGSLFKAIHERDIAAALKKQCHIVIDENFIKLPGQIKQTGNFTVYIEAMGIKEPISLEIVSAKK